MFPNVTRISTRRSTQREWQRCGMSALYITNKSPDIYLPVDRSWNEQFSLQKKHIIIILHSRDTLSHVPKAALTSVNGTDFVYLHHLLSVELLWMNVRETGNARGTVRGGTSDMLLSSALGNKRLVDVI